VHVENISVQTTLLVRAHFLDAFPFVRVVWVSMTEKPDLFLSIRPLDGMDLMAVPGLDIILHGAPEPPRPRAPAQSSS